MGKWFSWSVLGLGIWLVVSPWLLGFYASNLAVISNTIVGVSLVILSLWQLFGK